MLEQPQPTLPARSASASARFLPARESDLEDVRTAPPWRQPTPRHRPLPSVASPTAFPAPSTFSSSSSKYHAALLPPRLTPAPSGRGDGSPSTVIKMVPLRRTFSMSARPSSTGSRTEAANVLDEAMRNAEDSNSTDTKQAASPSPPRLESLSNGSELSCAAPPPSSQVRPLTRPPDVPATRTYREVAVLSTRRRSTSLDTSLRNGTPVRVVVSVRPPPAAMLARAALATASPAATETADAFAAKVKSAAAPPLARKRSPSPLARPTPPHAPLSPVQSWQAEMSEDAAEATTTESAPPAAERQTVREKTVDEVKEAVEAGAEAADAAEAGKLDVEQVAGEAKEALPASPAVNSVLGLPLAATAGPVEEPTEKLPHLPAVGAAPTPKPDSAPVSVSAPYPAPGPSSAYSATSALTPRAAVALERTPASTPMRELTVPSSSPPTAPTQAPLRPRRSSLALNGFFPRPEPTHASRSPPPPHRPNSKTAKTAKAVAGAAPAARTSPLPRRRTSVASRPPHAATPCRTGTESHFPGARRLDDGIDGIGIPTALLIGAGALTVVLAGYVVARALLNSNRSPAALSGLSVASEALYEATAVPVVCTAPPLVAAAVAATSGSETVSVSRGAAGKLDAAGLRHRGTAPAGMAGIRMPNQDARSTADYIRTCVIANLRSPNRGALKPTA